MSELVSLEDMAAHLGLAEADAAGQEKLLVSLIAGVQDKFERACGRDQRPYVDAQDARVEIFEGTGTNRLWLGYCPRTVTRVSIGTDPANPVEVLDVTDPAVLLFGVTSRRIVRMDGGVFGVRGVPLAVRVTYDAAADLPPTAQLAVMAGVAQIYRRLGAEAAKMERIGSYTVEYAPLIEGDPIWSFGVRECREPRL